MTRHIINFTLGIIVGAFMAMLLPQHFQGRAAVLVGVENYPPFISLTANGQATGISANVLRQISTDVKLDLSYTNEEQLSTLLLRLEDGSVDVVTSVKRTPERERIALFTKPYITVKSAMVSAVAAPKSVCVGAGFAIEAWMRETYPDLKVMTAGMDAGCLQMMSIGIVDAVAMDEITMSTMEFQPTWSIKRLAFSYPLSFAISKKRPELVELFNSAIE